MTTKFIQITTRYNSIQVAEFQDDDTLVFYANAQSLKKLFSRTDENHADHQAFKDAIEALDNAPSIQP